MARLVRLHRLRHLAPMFLPEHTPGQRELDPSLERHQRGDCREPVGQVRLEPDEFLPLRESERQREERCRPGEMQGRDPAAAPRQLGPLRDSALRQSPVPPWHPHEREHKHTRQRQYEQVVDQGDPLNPRGPDWAAADSSSGSTRFGLSHGW